MAVSREVIATTAEIELLASLSAVMRLDRYRCCSQLRSRFTGLQDPATSLSLSAFRSHGRRWPVADLSARMPHLSGRPATCDGRPHVISC